MKTSRKTTAGFTLVELMIVIVVVAIVVGIALPGYQKHVIKTKRSIAKGELMEVLARQEQFFVNNRQYATTLAALGLSDPYAIDANGDQVLTTADERIYEISLVSPTPTAFSVRALPQRGQTKDSWCGTLTISSTGVQSETGSAPLAECW